MGRSLLRPVHYVQRRKRFYIPVLKYDELWVLLWEDILSKFVVREFRNIIVAG